MNTNCTPASLQISRRLALSRIGGVLASGLAPWTYLRAAEGVHLRAKPRSLVDVHIHVALANVTNAMTPDGTARLGPFKGTQAAESAAQLVDVLEREMLSAGIGEAFCMPDFPSTDNDPLRISETVQIAAFARRVRLHMIGLADPLRTDRQHLSKVKSVLKQGQIKAFKAYLGYLHHGPSSPKYKPYYRLAKEFGIPVIFHTGDVALPTAKLKYCHPLLVDEVAVDNPNVTFVVAHAGNPWVADVAELLVKNENVWADLSALIIGTNAELADQESSKVWLDGWNVERIRGALSFCGGRYQRIMFGSDWPLVSLQTAVEFIKKVIPAKSHDDVLVNNARRLFRL